MENIALTDIDPHAFPRDRSHMDEASLDELTQSIARDGLRTPVEVTPIEGPRPYALLSGHRRHTAFTRLAELRDTWSTIPAFIRHPADIPHALRLIAEENAIRADISPWDQSRYAVEARNQGHFDTLDAAIGGLYASLSKQKRTRLRAVAEVVDHFEGQLTDPETLTQRKLTRIASAIRGDFTELMQTALSEQSDKSVAAQWHTLERILAEAEAEAAGRLPTDNRPGRPRRHSRLRGSLRVRRVYQPDGWTLVFTGRDAHTDLMERIMDDLERQFTPTR